jgi:hypothetical protein
MKLNLSQKEDYILEHFRQIFSYVFQILLVLFLLALLIKEFYPNTIDSLININWFMFAVIIIGAISILFPPKYKKHHERSITRKDKIGIIILGILGAGIIYLKLRDLGWISYMIAGLGGIIIIVLSWLIIEERDD